MKTAAELITFIKETEIEQIDIKYTDLTGRWRNVTVPVAHIDTVLKHGIPFDSSSVLGFRSTHKSDMALLPDITTAFIDPFIEMRTIGIIASIVEADTLEPVPEDPRSIARRAEQHLKKLGMGESIWMPEFEFNLFERLSGAPEAGRELISAERKIAVGAYHISRPFDKFYEVRSDMAFNITQIGISVRYHHHEAGGNAQQEIEIESLPLVMAADAVQLVKYFIRMTAEEYELTAVFLPKPTAEEAGNGMHFHQYLRRNGHSLFWNANHPMRLSKIALSYIGGLLDNAESLVAITNPSTNSYRRLVPGFEAPTALFFGEANRNAAVRIPKHTENPAE